MLATNANTNVCTLKSSHFLFKKIPIPAVVHTFVLYKQQSYKSEKKRSSLTTR